MSFASTISSWSATRWDTKAIITILLVLFVILQYNLWVSEEGVPETIKLQKAVTSQLAINQTLKQRNQILAADVMDLKEGFQSIEERARSDLGMVKSGETYYQLVR